MPKQNQLIRIYGAAVMATLPDGGMQVDPRTKQLVPAEETLEDITGDFAAEFKRWPVPRHHLEKALHDLNKAILHAMEKKGLLK